MFYYIVFLIILYIFFKKFYLSEESESGDQKSDNRKVSNHGAVQEKKASRSDDPCNDTVNTEDGTAEALQKDVNHSDSALKEKDTAVNEHTDINHSKSRSDEVDAEDATRVAQHKDVNHNDPCNDTVNTEDGTAEALQQDVNHSDSALKEPDKEDLDQVSSDTLQLHCLLEEIFLKEVLTFNFVFKDILTLTKSSLEGEEPQTLKEKLLYIITRIVMIDYRARDIAFCPKSAKLQENTNLPSCNTNDEIKKSITNNADCNSILMELSGDLNIFTDNQLHPSDVFVILMNSCDDILRQILVQKMSVCKLAIPLVYPNFKSSNPMFILGAMKFVKMNLETQLKGSLDSAPIVSALRLGDIPTSKSKILNSMLCNHPHDTYFHRDCTAGSLFRKLSNGVLELTWYLPGGRKEDHFDDAMVLLNLRDDAKNHSKQIEFINMISSTILVFISLQNISDSENSSTLERLSTSSKQIIFIILDTVNTESFKKLQKIIGNENFKTVLRVVNGKVKSSANFNAELRNIINVSIKSFLDTQCITKPLNWETISGIARKIRIEIDEDSSSSQINKKNATNIISDIQKEDISTAKKTYLPLQDKLWSEWSQWSKKQARLDDVSGRDHATYIADLDTKKQENRMKQYKFVENMTPCMTQFVDNLLEMEGNPDIGLSFMQWLKFQLDNISIKELPNLHKKYHSLWDELQKQKFEKTDNVKDMELICNNVKKIEEELDVVERDLIDFSFGLEHFMRELGQVYEAIVGVKNNKSMKIRKLQSNLPKIAAHLLISGFPLEIMDGDVGNMPLTWVKAVFDCLKSELGDKKVYVISVLGVQSSGKSTLLNTMFGLNFAVSAGRCTKGVYAQLIHVKDDSNLELGYDYILILDTEGLRAPEHGTKRHTHDNELATLAIGMGDITIINIKGENIAEIENILQISVHAFLKMNIVNKSIKLQPGCYLIHQNVPAVNANEKMLYGYKKIQENLDNITQVAAAEEKAAEIHCFRDVIDFDVKENIWHFSSLWQGDPPMAPANPNYSEKALELRKSLLMYPSKKKKKLFDLYSIEHANV